MITAVNLMYNAYVASQHSYCLKTQVGACLDIKSKLIFCGYNDAPLAKEIAQCPRIAVGYATGVGYHLCKDVCGQKYHAEAMAINHFQTYINDYCFSELTPDDPKEFIQYCNEHGIYMNRHKRMYIFGHDQPCEHCMKLMTGLGISIVFLCKSKIDLYEPTRWIRMEL